MKRCYFCFKEYGDEFNICPHCGQIETTTPKEPIQLAPGTVLANRYILGQAVGAGGFGIVYRAYDTKLEAIVAVKEFFVSRMVTRAMGLKNLIVNKKSQDEYNYRKERFLTEARNMAKFGAHRSIPNVFEFFEENNTAYIVMELLEGEGLNSYLREHEKVDMDFAIMITNEIGNALKSLHEKNIIHRDVAPDNIFICAGADIKIKLMDLGAAKLADSSDDVIDIILKPGYSPTEQYDNTGAIGPWTDIYALGATLYAMLTGIKPEESTSRKQNDTVIPPCEIDPSIPENLSNTVMKAMAIDKHMRFKSIDEFLRALNGEKKVLTLEKEKRKRKKHQIMGLSAAVLILACGGLFLFNSYKEMETEAYLDDATINVWYCAEAGSNEEAAMNYIEHEFESKFESVDVVLSRFSETDYLNKLKQAAEDGNMPSLYESTGLSDEYLVDAVPLNSILESEQVASCLFLKDYEQIIPDMKKFPLAIEVPMAMVITGGTNQVNYLDNTFNSLNSFSGTEVAFDSKAVDLLTKNWSVSNVNEEDFFGDGKSAVFMTSSMLMQNYKTKLLECEWHCAVPENMIASYTYEWSVSQKKAAEQNAAERLLMWMLGSNYQDKMMITLSQNGEIPINSECFDKMTGISEDWAGLAEIKEKIIIK